MHQPVRIHDSDGNPITATNPLEVDVKTLAAPATLPLPTGAATSAKQDTGNSSLSSMDGKLTDIATMQDDIALIKADIATIKGLLQ